MAKWSPQSTPSDLVAFIDEPEVKKQLKTRLRITVGIVVALLLILGFGAKPAYRAFRNHQLQSNFERAQVAARVQDWQTARDLTRSVLLAQPTHFEAFRLWSRALSELGEPRAYYAAAQLFSDERASEVDKLETLRVMC